MSNVPSMALIMVIAGVGIPIMATLNGSLGARLGSPALAVVLLMTFALFLAIVYLLSMEGLPTVLYVANTPWYYYLGGFFFLFYILNITRIAPHFGVANSVAFVLLGQMIAMALIDHFAVLGAAQHPLSLRRLAGLIVMTIGVFMVLERSPIK